MRVYEYELECSRELASPTEHLARCWLAGEGGRYLARSRNESTVSLGTGGGPVSSRPRSLD